MNNREIKRIPKAEIEKRETDERRAEIRMLEVYISRYPQKAKEFLERQTKKIIDNQVCIS